MTKSLVLLLALIACGDPTGTSDVRIEGSARYDAPALAERWVMMEACSGLKGDFRQVSFYTATRIVYKGVDVRGYWRKADNSIFLLESLKGNTTAIEHEETHALLQGGANHPAAYFIDGPCGNLMLP
jgi:hypothetical protein